MIYAPVWSAISMIPTPSESDRDKDLISLESEFVWNRTGNSEFPLTCGYKNLGLFCRALVNPIWKQPSKELDIGRMIRVNETFPNPDYHGVTGITELLKQVFVRTHGRFAHPGSARFEPLDFVDWRSEIDWTTFEKFGCFASQIAQSESECGRSKWIGRI